MTNNVIDLKEIKTLIPHRYPFLLVDKVINFEKWTSGTGIKNFTINEYFFQGHFPENPIVPGVFIIEAMAQTAAIIFIKSMGVKPNTKTILFTGIEKAKFKKPILPGDTLELRVKLVKQKMNIIFAEGQGFVNNVLTTETKFSATIVDIEKLI